MAVIRCGRAGCVWVPVAESLLSMEGHWGERRSGIPWIRIHEDRGPTAKLRKQIAFIPQGRHVDSKPCGCPQYLRGLYNLQRSRVPQGSRIRAAL